MGKPRVTLEGWIVAYRDGSPWFLSGFATGHPRLPGFRRFIQSSEIQEFDAVHSCVETATITYNLRYRLEDLAIDDLGGLRQARILDFTARRIDLRNEWLISRGSEVIEHVWASEFYEVVPMLLALVSEPRAN